MSGECLYVLLFALRIPVVRVYPLPHSRSILPFAQMVRGSLAGNLCGWQGVGARWVFPFLVELCWVGGFWCIPPISSLCPSTVWHCSTHSKYCSVAVAFVSLCLDTVSLSWIPRCRNSIWRSLFQNSPP